MLDKFIEHRSSNADTLEKFLNENLPVVKQAFLKNIVEGRIPLDNVESGKRLREMGIALPFDTVRAVIVQMDGSAQADGEEPPDWMGRLISAVKDIMGPICVCEVIRDMQNDVLILLLNYGREEVKIEQDVESACRAIQEQAGISWGITLTVVIGSAAGRDAHASYSRAVGLSGYRVKYGAGALITSRRVEADISGHDLFPEREEKLLLKELRALSRENCTAVIRQIILAFYGYTTSDILRAVNHILYNTFQITQEFLKNRSHPSRTDTFLTYEQLTGYRTLTELEDRLILLYDGIIREIGEPGGGGGDSSGRIIRAVTSAIASGFSNPMLSLEFIAGQVNLSPSYLGKIFKDHTGLYFTEYVNAFRIEKAKKMLMSSNENINRIATRVGYNSATYFVTTFKKYTGITPARFREIGVDSDD